jgi:hypothetical protein
MAEYSKTVPKKPGDADATLELVLEAVIQFTEEGDDLVRYQNQPDKVVLTFDGID